MPGILIANAVPDLRDYNSYADVLIHVLRVCDLRTRVLLIPWSSTCQLCHHQLCAASADLPQIS